MYLGDPGSFDQPRTARFTARVWDFRCAFVERELYCRPNRRALTCCCLLIAPIVSCSGRCRAISRYLIDSWSKRRSTIGMVPRTQPIMHGGENVWTKRDCLGNGLQQRNSALSLALLGGPASTNFLVYFPLGRLTSERGRERPVRALYSTLSIKRYVAYCFKRFFVEWD